MDMIAQEKQGDWKSTTFLMMGLAIGLLCGYYLNTEQSSKAKASEICGVCQENVGIMVKNFNVLVAECNLHRNDVRLNLTPYIGDYKLQGVGNAS
jgi:hypothetical protein